MNSSFKILTELIREETERVSKRSEEESFEWIAKYDGWDDSIIQDIITNPQLFQNPKLTKNTPYAFMVEVLTNDFLEKKFRTAPELFSGGDTITQLKPYNLSKTMKKNPFDTLYAFLIFSVLNKKYNHIQINYSLL